jgi:Xaa-Pro aminopeptidase
MSNDDAPQSAIDIPAERYAERLDACRAAIAARDFAALLIGVGPDLRYLSGFVGDPMERLTLLVVPAKGPVWFVVPNLEATKARSTPLVRAGAAEVIPFEETEDAAVRVANLLAGARLEAGEAAWEPLGLSDRLWAMHVLELQRTLPGRTFKPASTVMRDLREVKDADEARLLRLAAGAADRTVEAIAAGPLIGRTEAEVSREIRSRLVDEGHDVADFAIVGSGPNGASPHHEAGDRRIQAGEPVVLDIGGTLSGYMSDTTRTIWVAGPDGIQPDAEFRRTYDLVREANERATNRVAPGVAAQDVDAEARRVIAAGGYGEYFTHRTGHGIGLEVHEDPYIVAGNTALLRPGMAFSVEPGIYLPGRWGVRLENIVMCGEAGPDVLNRSSLDLRVVRG